MALAIVAGSVCAAETPTGQMQGMGGFDKILMQFEAEATHDISMAPRASSAIAREWRSFARDGSALGTLIGFGWVALVAAISLLAEIGTATALSRRPLRWMENAGAPTLFGMIGLVVCDLVGLAVFLAVFAAARRHLLPELGITQLLAGFATAVLLRWRIASLIVRAILRPRQPIARLIDISDEEAHRLLRFLSITILMAILLVAFARVGLQDEDSGAPHVVGLMIDLIVCALYVLIAFRTRGATEALIRGRRSDGITARIRDRLAHAWLSIALVLIAGLLAFFVAGLSLGLLSYFRAGASTLGVAFVALVLDRLIERVCNDPDPSAPSASLGAECLQARTAHHVSRAITLAAAVMILAWIWTDAIDMSDTATEMAMGSLSIAVGTLFVAFVAWELVRLAVDRQLQNSNGGPSLPGDEDDESAPASRLQTILPLLRAAFGVLIAVVATLIVLSHLGIDTAPLIAGAGVFGLAISFGSQSLVRDIISGLFYMWDDAFRVGEYIDTGRLKGTVETLGIRSVKLRHQNGPLHTIPYGQLGAVTNLSRDFATIKFNLRLEPGTDIELVRKTTKQIGLAMQEENPELAAEIMLPLKLQGIAEVVDNAVVLRFKFTARPVKPSWVQREYLKRIYQVFAEKGVNFASGALTLQTVPSRLGTITGEHVAAASAPAEAALAETASMAPAEPASLVAARPSRVA
jgi:small-conductance mechanosensitive channel